jgi:K+-transporting ATPase ATPase C chain
MKEFFTALRLFVVLSVLTGLIYPLLVTGIAQAAFHDRAIGSLIVRDGKVVGSRLIGQPFDDPKYFWSRPSATSPFPYNAGASSGSNLGPTNPALIGGTDKTGLIKDRVDALKAADPGNSAPVPTDLVTSSGSGLDPHISVIAAEYQIDRVARARGLSKDRVGVLVSEATSPRQIGLLGEPVVNVLELNLALDAEPK